MAANGTRQPSLPLVIRDDTPGAVELSLARAQTLTFSARSPAKQGPNEDAAALIEVDGEQGVIAVADGLGGQPGGASASQLAVECLAKSVGRLMGGGATLRTAILDGVEEANRTVLELGVGAATTLAVVELVGTTMRPYHVGDSAVLVVGGRGKVKLLTISHSPVGYAIESGLLDEQEALHHDDRHFVSNTVGDAGMRIEVGSPIELAPRDTVLLATDGVFDNMTVPEIVDAIRMGPLEAAGAALATVCGARMKEPVEGSPSKPDDLTFVLVRPSPQAAPG